jgi:hypothetical protein
MELELEIWLALQNTYFCSILPLLAKGKQKMIIVISEASFQDLFEGCSTEDPEHGFLKFIESEETSVSTKRQTEYHAIIFNKGDKYFTVGYEISYYEGLMRSDKNCYEVEPVTRTVTSWRKLLTKIDVAYAARNEPNA